MLQPLATWWQLFRPGACAWTTPRSQGETQRTASARWAIAGGPRRCGSTPRATSGRSRAAGSARCRPGRGRRPRGGRRRWSPSSPSRGLPPGPSGPRGGAVRQGRAEGIERTGATRAPGRRGRGCRAPRRRRGPGRGSWGSWSSMANSKSTRSWSRAVSSNTARPIPEYIWLHDERTDRTRILGPAASAKRRRTRGRRAQPEPAGAIGGSRRRGEVMAAVASDRVEIERSPSDHPRTDTVEDDGRAQPPASCRSTDLGSRSPTDPASAAAFGSASSRALEEGVDVFFEHGQAADHGDVIPAEGDGAGSLVAWSSWRRRRSSSCAWRSRTSSSARRAGGRGWPGSRPAAARSAEQDPAELATDPDLESRAARAGSQPAL